jgi:hypothetical protein
LNQVCIPDEAIPLASDQILPISQERQQKPEFKRKQFATNHLLRAFKLYGRVLNPVFFIQQAICSFNKLFGILKTSPIDPYVRS